MVTRIKNVVGREGPTSSKPDPQQTTEFYVRIGKAKAGAKRRLSEPTMERGVSIIARRAKFFPAVRRSSNQVEKGGVEAGGKTDEGEGKISWQPG